MTHQGQVMSLRRRQYLPKVTMVRQLLQNQRYSSRIGYESVFQLFVLYELAPFPLVLFRDPEMVFQVLLVVVDVLQSRHFGKLVYGVGRPGHVGRT